MKDLELICTLSSSSYITRQFETIMDFMDAFENNKLDTNLLNCTDIDAIFFESNFNQKHFSSIKELYEHCASITK